MLYKKINNKKAHFVFGKVGEECSDYGTIMID